MAKDRDIVSSFMVCTDRLVVEHMENETKFDPIFTDEAFMATVRIFASALSEKMWVLQEREKMSMNERRKMHAYAGEQIKKLVWEMTAIKTDKFYSS